jgi:hypothetical protein
MGLKMERRIISRVLSLFLLKQSNVTSNSTAHAPELLHSSCFPKYFIVTLKGSVDNVLISEVGTKLVLLKGVIYFTDIFTFNS